jgi:hypothetical protein
VDLWNTLQVVLRRWYVVVPLLIVTAVVTLSATNGIDPEYHASASMILLGPTGPAPTGDPADEDRVAGSGNPYAGSLSITATALQVAASGGKTSQDLAEAGLSTDYVITVPSRAPILNVLVDADSPDEAVATVQEAVRLVGVRLEELEAQVGVPAGDKIRVDVLRISDVGSTDYQARNRLRILLVVLGVILSVGAAVLVDSGAAKLRRRKQPSEPAITETGSIPTESPPEAVAASTHRALG